MSVSSEKELFPYEWDDPWVGGDVFEQVGPLGMSYVTRLEVAGFTDVDILRYAVQAGQLPHSKGNAYIEAIKRAHEQKLNLEKISTGILIELKRQVATERSMAEAAA